MGPDLATSWEATLDAKQWTFKLNKNAHFDSGSKVMAKDVIASLNYHIGKESSSVAKALLTDVEDIFAGDNYTITIKLGRGNAGSRAVSGIMFETGLGLNIFVDLPGGLAAVGIAVLSARNYT